MDKHLKNQLLNYLKHIENKTFADNEILKKEEIAVIYAYTEDIYEPLNERLRRNLGQLDTEFGKELDNILTKLPNFEGICFRGTSLNHTSLTIYEDALNEGRIITEYGLMSTSTKELRAKEFMRTSKNGYLVLFSVISKQGKNIGKYSLYENEGEVLFRANSQFETLNIDKSNDFITITLNEI